MNNYIAFLRGINVGGHNVLKMADLKQRLLQEGFVKVQSYIQSGNLVLTTAQGDKTQIAQGVSGHINKHFGLKVPVVVMTADELRTILTVNPFTTTAARKQLYFTFLFDALKTEHRQKLVAADYPNEDFAFGNQCLYLNCKIGAGKAKLTNTIIEKKLQLRATTRNLNTLEKMVALAIT